MLPLSIAIHAAPRFSLGGAREELRPLASNSRSPACRGGSSTWPHSILRHALSVLIFVLGLLLLAWITTGCREAARPAFELPVYFTCDTHGRLEPCGCFVGQFGGLTRLKTVLDAEAPDSALRLDIGDAAAGPEDFDFIEYQYMLRAFAALDYDALNIGAREAQFSLTQLREAKRLSATPLISANLLDAAGRRPVFESYRLVERGGYRIVLVGVLDPRAAPVVGEGLAIGDMNAAIQQALRELRGQADLIVLLAFASEETLSELAREFYECQVILGGKVRQPAQQLHRENRSLIYFVTNEARALGILRLRIGQGAGAPVEAAANEIRFLNDSIVQDTGFRELMQEYRREIRTTRLAVDDPEHLAADTVPGVRMSAKHVGTETCLACHASAASVWKASAHAQAFSTLAARSADADPKCIGCHTVGFGLASGYRREFGPDRLADVGCESCHGPGGLHVREKEGDHSIHFTFRPLDAGDCVKCHYGEFSRPFDWNEFWPLIRHGLD